MNRIAGSLGKRAPVSLRVNPDVDAATHPYISTGLKENKFGIAHEKAVPVYQAAARMANLEIVGIDCHIGSQITTIAPFLAALDKLLTLVDELRSHGIELKHLDLGGGLGIRYADETPPTPAELMSAIFARIDAWRPGQAPKLMFEFGRALVGEAGILLTRVEYLKENHGKRFAVVDAAMTELLRPALYQAWHGVAPVTARDGTARRYDIVGPVCESGDWLAKDRTLVIEEGDLLLLSTGAYGAVMASNYNSRPRPAEILVADGVCHVIRPRETFLLSDVRAGAAGDHDDTRAEQQRDVPKPSAHCFLPALCHPQCCPRAARSGAALAPACARRRALINGQARAGAGRARGARAATHRRSPRTPSAIEPLIVLDPGATRMQHAQQRIEDRPVQKLPAATEPAHHRAVRGRRKRHEQREGGKSDGDERSLEHITHHVGDIEPLIEPDPGRQVQARIEEGKQPEHPAQSHQRRPAAQLPGRRH